MEVIFLKAKIKRWIDDLEPSTHAKTLRMIRLLEEWGPELGLPYSKSFGRNLFELRIYGDQPVRIFYAFHRGRAVLLHACTKKSYRLDRNDLETAMRNKKQLD